LSGVGAVDVAHHAHLGDVGALEVVVNVLDGDFVGFVRLETETGKILAPSQVSFFVVVVGVPEVEYPCKARTNGCGEGAGEPVAILLLLGRGFLLLLFDEDRSFRRRRFELPRWRFGCRSCGSFRCFLSWDALFVRRWHGCFFLSCCLYGVVGMFVLCC